MKPQGRQCGWGRVESWDSYCCTPHPSLMRYVSLVHAPVLQVPGRRLLFKRSLPRLSQTLLEVGPLPPGGAARSASR